MEGATTGGRSLAGIVSVAVLLCAFVNVADGWGRPGRRTGRAARPSGTIHRRSTGPVALVWRKGISDYRRVIQAFKKHASFKVVSRPFQGGFRRADTSFVNSLKKLNPRLIVVVGGRAASLMKHFPTIAAVRVYTPILIQRNRTRNVFLAPRPVHVLPALRQVQPGLKRVVLVAGDDPTVRSRRYVDVAVKAGIKTRVVSGVDPGKLIWALSQIRFRTGDALLLVPDPEVITPLVLKAVLGIQHRFGVPVLTFSRRHVARGVLMAAHLDPESCGRAAAALAVALLRSQGIHGEAETRTARRRRRRAKMAEGAHPPKPAIPAVEVHWWFNPAAARLLRIRNERFQAINARPVGGGTERRP